MKKILIPLFTLFFLIGCQKENGLSKSLVNVITLPNGDEISVPDGFIHEPLLGVDTVFGKIVSEDNPDFQLIYDIGFLSGQYVDPDSSTKTKGTSINETFWYDEVDKNDINDPDCCLYITFIETGPANFISLNNQDKELVLAIMESYENKD